MKRYIISAEKMETIKNSIIIKLKSSIIELKNLLHGFQEIESSRRKIQ